MNSSNNGGVAMSVMDYQSANFGTGDEGGVSARKAWFFLPTGTVALAYNISGVAGETLQHFSRWFEGKPYYCLKDGGVTAPANEIVTTLEQSLLANPGGDMGSGSIVSIGTGAGAPTVVPPGNSSVPAGHWVHHDGKVYTPIDMPSSRRRGRSRRNSSRSSGGDVKLETGVRLAAGLRSMRARQRNGWRINFVASFLLEASHGPVPTGVNFAYAVLPGSGSKQRRRHGWCFQGVHEGHRQ